MVLVGGGGGGEETGIDPSALQSMIGTMKSSTGSALALVNGYVGQFSRLGVDTSSLTKAAQDLTWAQDQLPMLSTRRSLAQAVMDMNPGLTYTDIGAGPLDTSDAQTEAQVLAQAEASGNSKAARAAIQAIQQDIQLHVDQGSAGTAWLTAFSNAAGPQIAGLANTLHSEDGTGLTPLSKQDQQILNTFATGLAAVSKAGTLQQSTISQLTADSTLWSATMLLKYGPSGAAYGTQTGFVNGQDGQNGKPAVIQQGLLAQMTDAVYKASQNGTLTIPLNWQDAQWADQQKQLLSEMQSQDPFATMLQLDAQNKVAAGQVLAGPDGAAIAKALEQQPFMNYLQGQAQGYSGPGQYTVNGLGADKVGPFNREFLMNQQVIANFLNAATQDPTYPGQSPPRGTDALSYAAARAALNIIDAAPSPTGDNGITVSEDIRQALMNTFGRYMPDLAKSLADPGTSPPVRPVDGTYVIGVDSSQLDTFLQQICADKKDYATIAGMAGAGIGTSAALKIQGVFPPGLSNPSAAFSQLYGDISAQASAVGISKAQQEDMQNQVLNTMIGMAETGFGMIPGGTAVTGADKLLSLATPVIPQFPTDNAAKAEAAAQGQLHTEQIMAMVPFIQGLLKAGVQLPEPPPPGSFDSSGAPTATFFDWWADTGAGEMLDGQTLGDIPGGWVPGIQGEMGFGAGS